MKKVSRQREWQLRKIAEGRCRTCGKVRQGRSRNLCDECLDKNNHRNKKKRAAAQQLHPPAD